MGRLSLRARLVLGVIVLGAVGLAVANVATYASLRSFLFDRTDASLEESSGEVEHDLRHGRCGGRGDRPPPGLEPGDFVHLRSTDGDVLCSFHVASSGESAPSPPQLPTSAEQGYSTRARAGGRRSLPRSGRRSSRARRSSSRARSRTSTRRSAGCC